MNKQKENRLLKARLIKAARITKRMKTLLITALNDYEHFDKMQAGRYYQNLIELNTDLNGVKLL